MAKRTERHQALLLFYAAVATVVLIVFFTCMGASISAKAGENGNKSEKIISVICVKEGDTLWSIASDYYTSDYKDIKEMIQEIKNSNGISDKICIGQHLIVPHYINSEETL